MKRKAIPDEVVNVWFQQHADGELTWDDLMARANEYAPGKVSRGSLVRWQREWKRALTGEAPKPRQRKAPAVTECETSMATGPTSALVVTEEWLERLHGLVVKLYDVVSELNNALSK
jgi:hypothetical protein